jgi:hypothetical protein
MSVSSSLLSWNCCQGIQLHISALGLGTNQNSDLHFKVRLRLFSSATASEKAEMLDNRKSLRSYLLSRVFVFIAVIALASNARNTTART